MLKYLIFSLFLAASYAQGPTGPGHHDPRCPAFDNPSRPVHLPHPYDCSQFFKCSNGLAFPYNCPQGQHWSIRLDRCDWPE